MSVCANFKSRKRRCWWSLPPSESEVERPVAGWIFGPTFHLERLNQIDIAGVRKAQCPDLINKGVQPRESREAGLGLSETQLVPVGLGWSEGRGVD